MTVHLFPKPTHLGEVWDLIRARCEQRVLPTGRSELELKLQRTYYVMDKIEGVVEDGYDGQTYKITLEPIR